MIVSHLHDCVTSSGMFKDLMNVSHLLTCTRAQVVSISEAYVQIYERSDLTHARKGRKDAMAHNLHHPHHDMKQEGDVMKQEVDMMSD